MKNGLLLIILCLTLFAGLTRADNTRITVIDLKGRTAQEIIPLIKPMLDTGDAISGTGYQLIIRTTPEALARIEPVISQLDRAPRRLRISVHTGALSNEELHGADLHIDKRTKDVHVQAGNTSGSGGLSVEHSASNGAFGARVRSTETTRDADNRQSVQTLEGYPAHIASGVAFPYVDQLQVLDRRGGLAAGIDYRETSSGFYVMAQLRSDNQVFVEISPQRENLSNRGGGIVEHTALVTTVSGPLNTWLKLGGSGEESQQSSAGYTRTHRTHGSHSEEMWFKVEVLD